MDLFTYLMAKKGHNTQRDLFSYLLGKNAGGSGTYTAFSGTSLNISNTLKAKIKNFMLNSTELTQDGTPTPDTPQDVHVITGNNSVNVIGKNLFDKNNLNYIAGYLTVNGNKIESSSKTDTYYIECNPNTTYTLQREKVKTSGQVFRFASYSEVPTYNNQFTGIVGGLTDDLTLTITTGANDKYLAFSMGNVLHTDTKYIDKVQIEQGSSATTYEPYQNQTYPINLGTMELCKIGDYADQIFKNTIDSPYYDNTLIENEWYLKKKIGKIDSYNGETITTPYVSTTGGLDTGATIYYGLAAPTYIHISETDYPTLKGQLDNLYNNAESYDEQTNITQTNEDLPFNISVDVKVANL